MNTVLNHTDRPMERLGIAHLAGRYPQPALRMVRTRASLTLSAKAHHVATAQP